MKSITRVLIAGANGFIGSALHRWLEARSVAVYGIDWTVSNDQPQIGSIDLRDRKTLENVLEHCKPAAIFHLAGSMGSTDEATLYQVYVETTRSILRATRAICPATRVIVVGSAAEYGSALSSAQSIPEETPARPETAYGKAKLAQSDLAQNLGQELGLDVVRVRLFNTLGPGQGPHLVGGAMVRRLQQILADQTPVFEVYDPQSERDYLDVRDVARLLWLVATQAERNPWQAPIQIASGEATRVLDLAARLIRLVDPQGKIEIQPMQTNIPTRYIGAPTTLQQLRGDQLIRQISASDSLRDMWQWQIERDARGNA